jgi:hypothetical protein
MPTGSLWDTYVTLTRADLDMMRVALTQQIHNKRPGAAASWKNPESGNSGTVRLLDAFARQGYRDARRCRGRSDRAGTP